MSKYKNIGIFLITSLVGIALISYILSLQINFSYPLVFILNLIGFNSIENSFLINSTNIIINNFCSGLFSVTLFLIIMFSPITEIHKEKRYKIALFGSLVIYILNFVRILIILFFANIINNVETLHVIGWFFMSFCIFIIWWKWSFEKSF